MTDRNGHLMAFREAAGWQDARADPLAGDASSRRYLRLARDNGASAILMDADPATGQATDPFVTIARYLQSIGLRAPEILAWDADQGFLLLRDFGDDLISRVAARHPAREPELYQAATNVLIALHRHDPPDVPRFSPTEFGGFTDLAVTWYAKGITGTDADPAPLSDAVSTALTALPPAKAVLALRDYHAENLVWQEGRTGTDRVGLLDFQDAMIAHPAYDLVSMIEDARRDLSPETAKATLSYYLDQTDTDPEEFRLAFHSWGAQRNLRILGIFARLALAHGKPGYLDLIPRTWSHLMNDLSHPDLSELRQTASALLPEPTPTRLDHLKSEAARCQTP